MNGVDHQLVRPRDSLILLLIPPFDRTHHDPGYIKGYLPGIRENGGQYSHAALRVSMSSCLWNSSRLDDLDLATSNTPS